MCDEIGEVFTLGQVACKRRRGIQSDDHGARLQFVDDADGNLADSGIRHRQNYNVGSFKSLVDGHAG